MRGGDVGRISRRRARAGAAVLGTATLILAACTAGGSALTAPASRPAAHGTQAGSAVLEAGSAAVAVASEAPPAGSGRTASPSPSSATGAPSLAASAAPAPTASWSVPLTPPPLPTAPPPPSFALRVPILMYHRVAPASEIGLSMPSLVVDPAQFAEQVATLDAAGWRTITVAALAEDLAAGRRPAAMTLVITFDDGYEDGYRYALPILERHGFVATYFIVTGRLGEPGKLTDPEVATLAAAGMEVSDHTVRHLDLAILSPAVQAAEIRNAAATIARLVGASPMTFAYPFGDLDLATVEIVRSSGFWMAVTNRAGVLESWAGRLHVPRLEVHPGTSGPGLRAILDPYRIP